MQRMNIGNRRSTERLATEKSVINGIVQCYHMLRIGQKTVPYGHLCF